MIWGENPLFLETPICRTFTTIGWCDRRLPAWSIDWLSIPLRIPVRRRGSVSERRVRLGFNREGETVEKTRNNKTRWWLQIFFIFTHTWGKIPNLTHIFQMGWNHQLAKGTGPLKTSMFFLWKSVVGRWTFHKIPLDTCLFLGDIRSFSGGGYSGRKLKKDKVYWNGNGSEMNIMMVIMMIITILTLTMVSIATIIITNNEVSECSFHTHMLMHTWNIYLHLA